MIPGQYYLVRQNDQTTTQTVDYNWVIRVFLLTLLFPVLVDNLSEG